MANKEHLHILVQGVETWNRWREEHPEVQPDFSGANLRRASLCEANLYGVNLRKANLYWAHLRNAHLGLAYLNGADLSGADLNGADLSGARLIEADLSGADLNGAHLVDAGLRAADLSGARLIDADLRAADLSETDLSETDLNGADLSGACLEKARLVDTRLEGATLSDCRIYGISAWSLDLGRTKQDNLIISPAHAPIITVDNLEVAQFIYLLLNNEKIRGVINTITTKVVLILGRFTPKRKAILDAIREELRKGGRYIPVLFDFAGPSTRNTQETINTLAGLARFVIADITNPKSIPQELGSIVAAVPSLPIKPLLQSGHKPWGMYDSIEKRPSVMEIHRYKNLQELVASLETKVVAPAEAKAKELTAR